MIRIGFDNRSVLSSRLSGWERFAKELALELAPSEEITFEPMFRKLKPLVLERIRDFFNSGRKFDITFYPTFPPSPFSKWDTTVYTLYDMTWWKHPETSSFMGRYYYRHLAKYAIIKGAQIVTISDSVRAEIISHFNLEPSRVTSIYPGLSICISGLTEGYKVSNREKPYILFVGSVEPRKNLQRLIDAFRKSGLSHEMDLVIVGRLAWGNLPSGVVVYENQSDVELRNWYGNCQALIMPSIYEGFGLPVIEALSFGKMVMLSDIPVFREVAGELGTYFDPTSIDSISNALQNARRHPSSSFRRSAIHRAKEFNWVTTAREYKRLFVSLYRGK